MQETTLQLEGLRSALIGSFYSRFAVSDGYDFYFSDFVLSSREIASSDGEMIAALILGGLPSARKTANPDRISKSASVAACLDILVSGVELLEDSSLLITFSNDIEIRLLTDTPVVDWHWAVTESGGDPYSGCHIACFARGDIQGCMPKNSFKPMPLRGTA